MVILEQLTFNQWVIGSNPVWLINKINNLVVITHKPVKPWVPNGFQNTAPHLQRARARARPVSFCVKGAFLPVAFSGRHRTCMGTDEPRGP